MLPFYQTVSPPHGMAEEEQAPVELDEEVLKERESGIMELGKQYKDEGNAKDLGKLIKMIRPFTKLISKAKAAKLVRELVDIYLDMDAATGYEVDLCKECIEWAKEEKRTFLRQSLEARWVSITTGWSKKMSESQTKAGNQENFLEI